MNPFELPGRWRDEADRYERDGVRGHAALLRRVADDLEAALAEWELEALTLQEAADESGYSYSQLQRLVSEGTIENVGGEGAPRVRRRDLPRKAGSGNGLGLAEGGIANEVLSRRG